MQIIKTNLTLDKWGSRIRTTSTSAVDKRVLVKIGHLEKLVEAIVSEDRER